MSLTTTTRFAGTPPLTTRHCLFQQPPVKDTPDDRRKLEHLLQLRIEAVHPAEDHPLHTLRHSLHGLLPYVPCTRPTLRVPAPLRRCAPWRPQAHCPRAARPRPSAVGTRALPIEHP